MDPIATAITTALAAGSIAGLTETSKTAITDGYTKLKGLFAKKFGANSDVTQAISKLEAKPESAGQKLVLQEAIAAVKADQDAEIQFLAQQILMLVQNDSAGLGKFSVQNNATVQGQNIGNYQQFTQNFGNSPQTSE